MQVHGTKLLGYGIGAFLSIALIAASVSHLVPLHLTEVLGFVSGGLGVWLTVEENIWNFPIGIANSAFFLLLFLQSRLFADMSLQAVYIVLGFLGWYWWLRGGEEKTELLISHTGPRTTVILLAIVVAGTWGMTFLLQSIEDAAPFWDALTTVMSLAAQYMLTRKLLENWWVWIGADVIYIGLYAYKHLFLTSLLYIIFMTMCIAGLRRWSQPQVEASGASLAVLDEGVSVG